MPLIYTFCIRPLEKINNVYYFGDMNQKTPSKKVQLKRERRKQEIVEVALSMIADQGLDAFSLHKLAGRVKLTVGALYRYFDSKSALIAALEISVIRETRDAICQAVERWEEACVDESESVRELGRVVQAAFAYRELLHASPAQMRLIGGLMSNPKPLLDEQMSAGVIDVMLETLEPVRSGLAACEACGCLHSGNAMERSVVVWATARGVAETRKLTGRHPNLFDENTLFALAMRTLLLGWGADVTSLERVDTLMHHTAGG